MSLSLQQNVDGNCDTPLRVLSRGAEKCFPSYDLLTVLKIPIREPPPCAPNLVHYSTQIFKLKTDTTSYRPSYRYPASASLFAIARASLPLGCSRLSTCVPIYPYHILSRLCSHSSSVIRPVAEPVQHFYPHSYACECIMPLLRLLSLSPVVLPAICSHRLPTRVFP